MFHCVQTHSNSFVHLAIGFFLRTGRGERTQVQQNISLADFSHTILTEEHTHSYPTSTLAHKHTVTQSHSEIRALSERNGFAQAKTSTDVSMWMDFLWDCLRALI